jgi:hypothetical protein
VANNPLKLGGKHMYHVLSKQHQQQQQQQQLFHRVTDGFFMCFVWISEHILVISRSFINLLLFTI